MMRALSCLWQPHRSKRKAAETGGEGDGDDATELLHGTELLQAIANGTVEPNANPRMMLCGPDPVGQARDLLLLSNEGAVAKLQAAMIEVGAQRPRAWRLLPAPPAAPTAAGTPAAPTAAATPAAHAVVTIARHAWPGPQEKL